MLSESGHRLRQLRMLHLQGQYQISSGSLNTGVVLHS